MKKYIFLFSIMMLIGCSVDDYLEKLPPYQADLDGAIVDAATAELALVGVYSNLPSAGWYSTFFAASGSFKAGTMRRPAWWTRGNAVYYYERYWPVLSGFRDPDWDADYELIKNADFLLAKIIEINDFEDNRKDEIIGELHFLRAVAYERLMRKYAEYWNLESKLGLIIRNSLPSIKNVKQKRSSVKESYDLIIRDLDIAIEKCAVYKDFSKASKIAAKAYKTRVLFQMKKYNESIALADEIISSPNNKLAPDYASLFTNYANTSEILFARVFGSSEIEDLEARITSFAGGLWGPAPNYVDLVKDDPRYSSIIGDSVIVNYRYGKAGKVYKNATVKKLTNSSNDLPLIYIRMAEIYLLKAEAIYRKGGSFEEAYAALEAIRNRAGAASVPHSSKEEIEKAICDEWLIEMSFENWHEYFALRRFGMERLLNQNEILNKAYEKAKAKGPEAESQYRERIEHRRILPIPPSELSGNPVEQNPGYE